MFLITFVFIFFFLTGAAFYSDTFCVVVTKITILVEPKAVAASSKSMQLLTENVVLLLMHADIMENTLQFMTMSMSNEINYNFILNNLISYIRKFNIKV